MRVFRVLRKYVSNSDWQAVNVRRELLDKLRELPDAKHMSGASLVNRAIDEWLANRNRQINLSQLTESIQDWSEEERMAAFVLVAKYVAVDIMAQNSDNDGELALQCWRELLSGKLPEPSSLSKLATAIGSDPVALRQKMTKLMELPKGT